ncbi:MAG TPA: hypothetical protein PLX56_06850 [bacterium]|nr:hypothetical protein [bacterium]HQN74116.1 hypothetical protein [bacterium]HQO92028.1 hypothetical protein [bacterium]
MKKKVFIIFLVFISLMRLSADEPDNKISRTDTEWMALSGGGGTHGPGGNISFFTVRQDLFFWEIFMLQATFLNEDAFSFNVKSIYGIPLFVTKDNRNEFRFGTGISAGMSIKFLRDEKNRRKGIGSILNIPVEITYVNHIFRFFSLSATISVDFPVHFEYDNQKYYTPVINGFLGFRI